MCAAELRTPGHFAAPAGRTCSLARSRGRQGALLRSSHGEELAGHWLSLHMRSSIWPPRATMLSVRYQTVMPSAFVQVPPAMKIRQFSRQAGGETRGTSPAPFSLQTCDDPGRRADPLRGLRAVAEGTVLRATQSPERRIGVERISARVGDGGPASGMQTVETTLFPEARPVPDRLQQNAISPPARVPRR